MTVRAKEWRVSPEFRVSLKARQVLCNKSGLWRLKTVGPPFLAAMCNPSEHSGVVGDEVGDDLFCAPALGVLFSPPVGVGSLLPRP